jgi:GntR family transcriptional regulator, transcriptional repressor for pyruvate dehydrogenase complex
LDIHGEGSGSTVPPGGGDIHNERSERAASQEALEALMQMIRSKELGPGDRLPTERQLAENMKLSRNTVREAIRALELISVLEVRRGDGTYVTSLEPQVLLRATTFVVQLLQDHSVVEMLEVRAILESAVTEMATARISGEDLREIERSLDDFGSEPWSEQWLEADQRFHALVARAANNEFLASFLGTLSAGTSAVRNLQGDLRPQASVQIASLQHRRIYEAIARRDSRAASLEAGAHVSGTAAWLRAVLQTDPRLTTAAARREDHG